MKCQIIGHHANRKPFRGFFQIKSPMGDNFLLSSFLKFPPFRSTHKD
jgi:hypothetical protein